MKVLAVIPARSGSRGLPDKNIKLLNGKPLMAYSIEAALQCGLCDRVHVSTDSEEYAEIGRRYGADVPFLRSAEMSSDTAGSWDVVLEVLQRYEQQGESFDAVILLQPTSPLRRVEDIQGAFKDFVEKDADSVVSMCEMDHSPLWSNVLPENLSLENFTRPEANRPRQQLPTYYRPNGAIYIVKVDYLRKSTDLSRSGGYAYIMDKHLSPDIDTQFDFDFVEFLLKKKEEEKE